MKSKIRWFNLACVAALAAIACAVNGQTYNLGSDSSDSSQSQPLGWGSNIQNARIARAAQLALKRGDYAHALEYAERATQAAPSDPQLWFLLGYAARLNSRYQQSADAYNHGLSLNASSLEGLSGLAQTYRMMGKSEDAERLLKTVLTADPRRANDALVLGDLYMRSGDYASALEWLNRAEKMHPDARPELLMAICFEHTKRMDMANRYLELAKKHAPDNPEVQRTLAGSLREAGEYPEAIAALRAIHSPRPDVVAELAYTYQLNGELSDSAKYYAQAADAAKSDLGLQLSAAQAQVTSGSLANANPFLRRAESLDPNSYRLHAIRGEIERAEDHVPQAEREYKTAVANLPAEPAEGPLYGIQLHMDLMQLYKEENNQEEAHRQLEIAQQELSQTGEQGPQTAPFLRLRALIRMNAGDLNGAVEDAEAAVAADHHDPNGLLLNGDVLVKLGRADEAIGVYKKVLEIDPVNRYALTALGYASRAVGNTQAAERYFERLKQVAPSLYVPYLALGDLFTAEKEFKAADGEYEKAFALKAENPLIVAGGMNAAIEAHDLDLAAKWLNRSTSAMTEEPAYLRELERYLSFKGDYQQSAKVGEQAIKALPQDRDVVVYLGYDLLRLGRYDELLSLTQRYMDILPKEPDIPLLMGYVHKHQGRSDEARQDFTETLKRDPGVVTAYVNRGFMLNDLNRPDAAAADFEEALRKDEKDGEAHLGLAYADLDLHKPQAAIRHADLAEQALGDSKNVRVIRATAYGREDNLVKAATEYRAALNFTPHDAALHLGLANTLFSERQYHETIRELQTNMEADDADADALLARSYARIGEREQALHYVALAENSVVQGPGMRATGSPNNSPHLGESHQSTILVATGEALSTLGEQNAAMDRFRRALEISNSNRMSVRLAIAQSMAQEGRGEDAEREIALALMEAESGESAPPSGNEYILAADVFRSTHDYQLSQTYMERAKTAGAPDLKVRIGRANNYLAMGESAKANAELSAIRTESDNGPDYQYLLARANVFRQEHENTQALTAFAQASNAGDEDNTAATSMMQTGADEGLRITPNVSALSDFSVDPIFEDTTVYVLDSKLDTPFPVPASSPNLLPPPRSSLQIQSTNAFHLHVGRIPEPGGFFQVRNAQGQISVPATNSIVNRSTTDYTLNFGLNPTVNLGRNVVTFSGGVQTTIRRDSESPAAMNQNLFRLFAYVTTSSFFNAVSMSGYLIREAGPFTESNMHSRDLTAAVDFRVGSPWGKNALLMGWGATDQVFTPENRENYYTSSYVGFERRFSERLMARGMLEDLRAWRVVGISSGIAQNVRPAALVDFSPKRNWDIQASGSYSSTRSYHVYDAIQSGFSVSYARPFRRKFHDDSGEVVLQYPIRFSAGVQQETFFNFTSGQKEQIRPYFQISLF